MQTSTENIRLLSLFLKEMVPNFPLSSSDLERQITSLLSLDLGSREVSPQEKKTRKYTRKETGIPSLTRMVREALELNDWISCDEIRKVIKAKYGYSVPRRVHIASYIGNLRLSGLPISTQRSGKGNFRLFKLEKSQSQPQPAF